MNEFYQYLLLSGAVSLILSLTLFIVWIISVLGYADLPWKSGTALLVILMSAIAPATYVILTMVFGVHPPRMNDDLMLSVGMADTTSSQLAYQAQRLSQAMADPKELTISQMESLILEALNLSQDLRNAITHQDSIIHQLSSRIVNERMRAEEATRLALEVQSITRKQLEAVKLLISEDATESNRRSFIQGVALSFPIGIVTSLIATWIFRRYGKDAADSIHRKFRRV